MKQKPSIGRIVIVKGITANGSDEHPAIINRVWNGEGPGGSDVVNLTAFPDCGPVEGAGSVFLFATREDGIAYLETQNPEFPPRIAFWPPRV